MPDNKRIIEVGGVKMEVDLRYAKQVEHYKVGDNVKVLVQEYGDKFQSFPGIIVGFDNFVERPTIVVSYLKVAYSTAEIVFVYLTKDSKNIEICPMMGEDLVINKEKAIELLDGEILKKEEELIKLKNQKAYFVENFKRHFMKSEGA